MANRDVHHTPQGLLQSMGVWSIWTKSWSSSSKEASWPQLHCIAFQIEKNKQNKPPPQKKKNWANITWIELVSLTPWNLLKCMKQWNASVLRGRVQLCAGPPLPLVCLVFTHSSTWRVAWKGPHQAGLTSATPFHNNLTSQSVNEENPFDIIVSAKSEHTETVHFLKMF